MGSRLCREEGVALVIAVMTMMLMTGLGAALVLTTMTESGVSAAYADGVEAFYAADAAVERALSELRVTPDWNTLTGVRFEGSADALLVASQDTSPIRVVLSLSPAPLQGGVVVRGHASSPRGVERTVEATVAHAGEPGSPDFRVLAWREVR